MKAGFIGLGDMGGDQVRSLLQCGFAVTVFDVYAEAMKRFADTATLATSVADVAHSADIVGVCVRDDAQVRATLDGPAGLIANMQAGSIILIHSTIRPQTVVELAQRADARGIDVLDASVSRTRMNASGQFVAVMVGGREAALERARPVLNAYASDILYAGASGAGVGLKIVNNLVTWSSVVTVAQAFKLAAASGVEASVLHALMTKNGNLTPVTGAFSTRYVTGKVDLAYMASQTGIGDKDLELAASIAELCGVTIPVAEEARAYLRRAMLDE
jgi:3-hydroxyisobutyrate dehydrogenase